MQYYMNRFVFKSYFLVYYLDLLPFSYFIIEKFGNTLIPSFHISKKFISAGEEYIHAVQIWSDISITYGKNYTWTAEKKIEKDTIIRAVRIWDNF